MNELKEEEFKVPNINNPEELLLAYHYFYLKWRRWVSDSSPHFMVELFLSKMRELDNMEGEK